MATIVTRAGKGSPLTHTEVDANFTNLNDESATKAPLASPALTGTPTAPTATVGTNTTQIATTAFVNAEIANDAPTKTGGGASGTWGISISGTSANTTSISSAVGGGYTWTGAQYFQSNANTGSSAGAAPLQAYSTGGNGAIMSFHRAGVYAVNMGLDSDNVFRIGGWSAGANRLQLDMSGNLTVAGTVVGSGVTYGAVGSYAFLVFRGASFLSAGTNIAGSSLIPGGVYGNTIVGDNSVANANGSALSTGSGALGGTWQAVGAVTFSSGSNFSRGTVFLRIS